MNDIQQLTEILRHFRDERDWAQFHNAKDLALALNIEAAELLEVSPSPSVRVRLASIGDVMREMTLWFIVK